jgi:hypothetical protein
LEPELEGITCSSTEIELVFDSVERLEDLGSELEDAGTLVAITSHTGCNEEGERAPHVVSGVVIDPQRKTVKLSKVGCDWKDVFTDAELSFDRSHSHTLRRRQQGVWKRQNSGSPTKTATHHEFPTITGKPKDLPSKSGTKLDMNLTDTAILPPDIPGMSILGVV